MPELQTWSLVLKEVLHIEAFIVRGILELLAFTSGQIRIGHNTLMVILRIQKKGKYNKTLLQSYARICVYPSRGANRSHILRIPLQHTIEIVFCMIFQEEKMILEFKLVVNYI